MNQLRLEAEDAQEKVEELKGKVKTLEQENLSKEQEITSLNHRNQVLEAEVEKMESTLKEAKDAANQSAQHDTQNEALQRRLQILEEEAEEADRNLRETNEKYALLPPPLTPPLIHPCRSLCPCIPLRCGLAGTGMNTSRLHVLTLVFPLQAPPNRRQGWSLRTQGAGARVFSGPVGEQVRGDGKEAHRIAKGPARPRGLHQQRLRRTRIFGLGTGVKFSGDMGIFILSSNIQLLFFLFFFFKSLLFVQVNFAMSFSLFLGSWQGTFIASASVSSLSQGFLSSIDSPPVFA